MGRCVHPRALFPPSTPSAQRNGVLPPQEPCRALTLAGLAIRAQLVARVAEAAGTAAVALAAMHAAPVPVSTRVPHCGHSTEPGSAPAHRSCPSGHGAEHGAAAKPAVWARQGIPAAAPLSAPSLWEDFQGEILQKAGTELGNARPAEAWHRHVPLQRLQRSCWQFAPEVCPSQTCPRTGTNPPNPSDCCVCNIPVVASAAASSQLRTSLPPAF